MTRVRRHLLILLVQSGSKNLKSPGKKSCEIKYIKKFFREIAFLAVLHFFPVQKLIFGHYCNWKKWNLVKKNRGIDLLDFTSFFGLDYFKFSGPL